jgi:hypothetical protein
MATSRISAGFTRKPVFLAVLAIVVFHASAVLAIFLVTRSPAPGAPIAERGGSPGAAALASTAPPSWPSVGEAPPPPVPDVRAEVLATAPEILSAPVAVQMEPVVPLPLDPGDRANALAAVRRQRLARMLEQRMNRRTR